MDSKKGKKDINQISINGFNIAVHPLSSIQYFYEYNDLETEGISSLNYISNEFRKDFGKDFQVLLFAVSPDWLKDSKIFRHKKYWYEIENHNLLNGKVELKYQSIFEDSGYVRHGLICSIPNHHFTSLLQFSLENKTSGVFILKNSDSDFETIAKNIFESSIYKYNNKLSSLINWESFIKIVIKNSGIALIPQGWYDFGAIYLNVIGK